MLIKSWIQALIEWLKWLLGITDQPKPVRNPLPIISTDDEFRRIQTCIKRLRGILHRWDVLQNDGAHWIKGGIKVVTASGLCGNANLGNLPFNTDSMFIDWKYYAGCTYYPVEGLGFMYRQSANKYSDPKRYDLAVHCIEYLNRVLVESGYERV